jgi:uncharacterized SAM-binding protein YcdF (DUF218 family)
VLTIAEFGKSFIPGSPWLLLLAVTLGAAMLFARTPRIRSIGRLLLAVIVGGYWLLSVPAVAEALQYGVPPMRLPVLQPGRGDLAIVVLGSGVRTYRADGRNISTPSPQSAFNIIEGSRLFKTLGNPQVILTGGIADASVQRETEADVLAPILQAHGVPQDRISLERRANTTHAQAIEVALIAKTHGFKKLVVVSSPAHLRRAVPAFLAQGVDAVGSPAAFASERRIVRPRWIPTLAATEMSRDAIYEYFGWMYYWLRGWLAVPTQGSSWSAETRH